MRIGIFDSGLGGLIIAKNVIKLLPKYNYTYLGDTKNIPYGNKTQNQIYNLTKRALVQLFKQDCKLVIIACNTSSAKALRKVQREFLPKYFPDRKVLGVIVPTLESIPKNSKKIGVLATTSTVKSHAYKKELFKLNPKLKVIEQSAPELASLIEAGELGKAQVQLIKYINKLISQNVDTVILGCTHYCYLKDSLTNNYSKNINIISQDVIIPKKLREYLKNHPEIKKEISSKGSNEFYITKINTNYSRISDQLFGKKINFKLTNT